MRRAAALAIALQLSGSAVASAAQAPITEIALAQCYLGLEVPSARSPLEAFVLTPDGHALRATVPAAADLTTSPRDFESADIGTAAYRAIAHQIETSPFFELSRVQTGNVITDTRGTRVSAVRATRRITWASNAFPSDREAMIMAVLVAVYDRVQDPHLTWIPVTTKGDPFALCREPVQMGSPFGN